MVDVLVYISKSSTISQMWELCACLGSNQGPNDYESFATDQLSYRRSLRMRSPLCCRVINYRWSSPSYLTLYLRGQHLQLLIPFSREQHAKDTPRDADLTGSVMCTLVARTGFEPVLPITGSVVQPPKRL